MRWPQMQFPDADESGSGTLGPVVAGRQLDDTLVVEEKIADISTQPFDVTGHVEALDADAWIVELAGQCASGIEPRDRFRGLRVVVRGITGAPQCDAEPESCAGHGIGISRLIGSRQSRFGHLD